MGFFDDLQKKIASKAKGVHCSIMSESKIATVSDWVKSPTYDLNRIISGDIYKALPTRQLLALVGLEGTMKSSLMILLMADAQKQGFRPIIIDTERGITNEFCLRWGMDPTNAMYIYTPWEDEIRTILAQLKESGEEKMIIGIDSIGGMDRIKVYEDAVKGDPKGDQGQLQKAIKTDLKLLLNTCVMSNSIGIITAHQYPAMASVPMPDVIAGGRAVRLFPTIILQLKKHAIKDTDKTVTGQEITVTTLKNRLYPPFQDAVLNLDYNTGLEPHAGMLDLAIAAGILTKDGTWYMKGEEKFGYGPDRALKALKELDGIFDEMNTWLTTTGYSTINENVKAAEELVQKDIEEDAPETEVESTGTTKKLRKKK